MLLISISSSVVAYSYLGLSAPLSGSWDMYGLQTGLSSEKSGSLPGATQRTPRSSSSDAHVANPVEWREARAFVVFLVS